MGGRSEGLPNQTSAQIVADPCYHNRAIAVAAREVGATPAQLVCEWRAPIELVHGRFAVMAALSRRGFGPTAIGRRINRDHSTVRHGLKRARSLLATDADFASLFAKVDGA